MKRLIASVLGICLLLGVCSGIQVSAMGYTAEDNLGVNLVQAVAMPEEWSYSIPDVDHERVVIPVFSKSMGNTYNDTKKTYLCLTLVGKTSDYSLGDALGNPLTWTMTMQWNTAIPSPNSYYARLDSSKMLHLLPAKLTDEQRQKYTTDIDTISEIVSLAKDLDCRLMFRMWEQGTGITTGDGYVDSYYNGGNCLKGNLKVTSGGNISTNSASNVYDCASVELMQPEDTLHFLEASYVRQDSGARLQLTFSEPIDYSGRDADAEGSFWSGVRILNASGQPMAYDETTGTYTTVADNANATPLQTVLGRLWDIVKIAQSNSIISLNQTQADAVEGLITHLDALKQADPENEYKLVFAITETGVNTGRGEGKYNHFVDGIWSLNTDKVLLSDFVADSTLGVADTAAAELQVYNADEYQTPEESAKVLSVTMTSLTDRRLTVTFDRPMHINKIGGAYLTYKYAPSTSDEGFWQYGMQTVEYAAIRQAVADAIAYPTTLTKQTTNPYTAEADGIDLDNYTPLEFDYKLGYWNPANTSKYNQVITSTSATDIYPYQHIAISERFTPETLPVGSVIVVDNGWKARFRYWNEDVSHNGAGALITGTYVVSQADWDTEQFRAIHLMDSAQTYLSDAPDTHIKHIRIYIPNGEPTLNADGIDLTKYVQLDPAFALGYWNPGSATSYNKPIASSLDNYHINHVALLERFTPDTLPVGSIITVDEGYWVRFRYWNTDVQHSGAGEELKAGKHTVTSAHWDTEIYRAMHIMYTAGGTFTDATAATAMSHVRIYVPRTATVNDDGIDMSKFDQWDYDYEVGYYNPSNTSTPSSVITPTNDDDDYANNFIAVSDRVTAQTLPVGSIIVVDDGYYVRFRYWNTDGYYANAVGETVTNRYCVGVQHWDTETIRALHLSLDTIGKISDNVDSHIAHLRIYIPKA